MGWDPSAPFPIGGDPEATIPYCTELTTVAPGDLSTLSASDAGVREGASGRRVTLSPQRGARERSCASVSLAHERGASERSCDRSMLASELEHEKVHTESRLLWLSKVGQMSDFTTVCHCRLYVEQMAGPLCGRLSVGCENVRTRRMNRIVLE